MKKRVKKRFLGLFAGIMLLLGSTAAVMAADLEEDLQAAQFENSIEATASASSSTVVQTKATTSSFTLSWGKITNAKYYNIYYRKVTGSTTDSIMVYSPSVVINHLSANSKYNVTVKAYTSKGTLLASTGTFTCKTLPGQPGFRGKSTDHSTGKMTLYFKTPSSNAAVEGYRVKYTNVSTKGNKTLTTSNLSYCYLPLKYSAYYKVEVNGYITLNGKKVYGTKRTIYLAQQPKIYKKSSTKSTMTMRWNKVAGATNYSVYVSTSPNSGYKKVKTTTGTTYTKTGMKIGKSYYIYVVANRRVGNTTYKSPADYYSKFYLYYQ